MAISRYAFAMLCGVLLVAAGCENGDSSPTQQPAPAPVDSPPAPAPADSQPVPVPPDPSPTTQADGPVDATVEAVGRGSRVSAIRARGVLVCGGRGDSPGFGLIGDDGSASGFDVDLCRAVAVAALGSPDAFEWRAMAFADRATVMPAGQVDVLTMQTTWTTKRDAEWGDFVPTMFYDGQGFMTRRSLGVASANDLQNVSICVSEGSTTQNNLMDFIATRMGFGLTATVLPDETARTNAYLNGTCEVMTSDISELIGFRSTFPDRDQHVLLPETLSEEPLTPMVPHGDSLWFDIVKTVMSILIYAEAYGATSNTVPIFPTGNVKVDRLFGLFGDFGQASLGLPQTVAQDIIRAVGNYGEIYERHIGIAGLGVQRAGSRNALWSDAPCQTCPKGGQLYAAPPQ